MATLAISYIGKYTHANSHVILAANIGGEEIERMEQEG